MFPVPFADAIAKPRTVVIISRNALLAHPAVLCSQRHVQQALSTEPERYLNLACSLAPLNGREVLFSILLIAVPALRIVSILLILDHHGRSAIPSCQGVQMLLYHMLAGTPLHLARVLD